MQYWTTYDNLTQEQQEHAVQQYLHVRAVEEQTTVQQYMNKYSYTTQDIIDTLKEKRIEVDTNDDTVFVDI